MVSVYWSHGFLITPLLQTTDSICGGDMQPQEQRGRLPPPLCLHRQATMELESLRQVASLAWLGLILLAPVLVYWILPLSKMNMLFILDF